MMKTKRLLTSVLAGAMVLASAIPVFAAETDSSSGSNSSAVSTVNSFDFISYEDYLARYSSAANGKKAVEIKATEYDAEGTDAEVSVEKNVYGDKGECLFVPLDGTVQWKFDVPDAGLYNIKIVYGAVPKDSDDDTLTSSTNNIERVLNINGDVPFKESRHLSFKKSWTFGYTENEDGELRFEVDSSGNELRPKLKFVGQWETLTLFDTDTYYSDPFLYYFNKGENTISLYGIREDMYIKSITVAPATELPSYEEYIGKGYTAADAETIHINAETPAIVSSSTITPGYDRSSAITEPQDAIAIKRNIIGGTNWANTSDFVKYNINVEKDGLYSIVLRFKQDANPGVFVSRGVMIDGEYPFEEAKDCRFDYSQDWQVAPLGNGQTEFRFYLTAGEHELTLMATVGEFGEILTKINDISEQLNEDYLQIVKLTGAYPDETRDYGFSRVMPDVIRNIADCAEQLEAIVDYIGEMAGGKSQNTSTLETVALTLRTMGESERNIAENLSVMKSHISSLSTWCSDLSSQPLEIDYINVQSPDVELPTATANLIESLKYEFGQFFGSFYADYNTFQDDENEDDSSVGENGSIECWTSSGRDQATIIRDLTNSGFCKETGISVALKLVDGSALLPSILAGIGPDISLDLTSTIDYALRGAVLPLNDMEGFDEVIDNFYPSALTELTLYGKTYALPTTLEFPMMFVRNDILSDLGLEAPKTWDDFLALIPVLQFNNMTVILPNDAKQFLYQVYQVGGNVWDETSANEAEHGWRCTFDDNLTLTKFTEMCNMFTQYSLLASADFNTRFKTGVAPVGIASYSTYTTLSVFAPEIAGLWEMLPIPGTAREDGTIDYTTIVTVSGLSLLKGVDDAEATWKFMCWYTGVDFQVDYCNELIALLGESAKTTTANRYAMAEMPWSASEYASLIDQYEHSVGIPSYPGSYVISRYMTMAFNAAYNDGANPSEALLQYVNAANKEITRKRTEFNLPTYEDSLDSDDAVETETAK